MMRARWFEGDRVMAVPIRPPVKRGPDGYYHPSTEEEIAALVRFARREGRQLRVRGAAHSVSRAIFTDAAEASHGGRDTALRSSDRHLNVLLDRYTAVAFDDTSGRVTVQAGCHLGYDPRDPTGTSTWASSLLAQLDERGWALPDLGGVTHQTIAGFLLTGSCGGTVQHAFEDAVVALRIVDGTGHVRELVRGRDDLFEAAVCSMGLLGIVSTVTLQCVPRYNILGHETITDEDQCPYALFGDGPEGLAGFFRSAEYARLMWWPQEGVRRVVTWQARRMRDADYGPRTGPRGALTPKRYSALGDSVSWPGVASVANLALQAAGGLFYDSVALAGRMSTALGAAPGGLHAHVARLRNAFAKHALPSVLRQFVPAGTTQHFWDSWCRGLPLDNQMSESSLPTDFTEVWLPLDRAGEIMRTVRAHYDRAGYDATGAFLCEVYAARATRAWMHPGHGRDSLRLDFFWFRRNPGDPTRGWFVQFWELLRPFGYRLHWGKYLPADRELGAHHLRRHTARWDDFLAARARLDPDCVFLTRYWRSALGVGSP
jgi:D-arabinono-1,4-lactone oxidase